MERGEGVVVLAGVYVRWVGMGESVYGGGELLPFAFVGF